MKYEGTPRPWYVQSASIDCMPYLIVGQKYAVAALYGTSGGKASDGHPLCNYGEAEVNAKIIRISVNRHSALMKRLQKNIEAMKAQPEIFAKEIAATEATVRLSVIKFSED